MSSEKRRFQREKRRVSCEFALDGHIYKGFVSDLSARGLFIHTTKHPVAGCEIEILLRGDSGVEIELRCQVARVHKVPTSVTAVSPSGFGAEIEYAPEAFFELLVDLGLG